MPPQKYAFLRQHPKSFKNRAVPDEKAEKHKMIRIVDESSEDYLYSEKSFVAIELLQVAEDDFTALT